MKISTKGRYGLRAMMDLATHGGNGTPVFLSDIAKRQAISDKYLEQIFAHLHRAGLVKTVRGRKGGYLLTRPAIDITLKEITAILEGPCILVDCVAEPEACSRSAKCATRDIWTLLGQKMDDFLASFTLAQLADIQKEKTQEERHMYYI